MGQLSCVGPRPPLPSEVTQYDERAMRRLSVKPGLTGYWQVRGRSDTGFEEMVDMDSPTSRKGRSWLTSRWSRRLLRPCSTGKGMLDNGLPARIEIMGAPIDPYTMEQTVSRTKDFVETGVFAHLAGVNADKLLQMRSDQTMDRMIRQCEIVNATGLQWSWLREGWASTSRRGLRESTLCTSCVACPERRIPDLSPRSYAGHGGDRPPEVRGKLSRT